MNGKNWEVVYQHIGLQLHQGLMTKAEALDCMKNYANVLYIEKAKGFWRRRIWNPNFKEDVNICS